MNKYLIYIIGAIIGGVIGFTYWNFVGCDGASCAIWASPTNSVAYGSLLGAVGINVFRSFKSKDSE